MSFFSARTDSSKDFSKVVSAAGRDLPLVELRGVSRVYEKRGVAALSGVDFCVREGESVAIVGPSGCGKTTLLNVLGALDEPDSGRVLHRGVPLSGSRERTRFRRNTIGFVFQAFHLLPALSAWENVQVPMFGTGWNSKRRAARALELLEWVGMADRRDHLPSELSGGEKQRVAIARSLANDPVLLLADEPTGNLDSANRDRILELLERLHRERGVGLCLVTHDPALAEFCARQVHLLDGKILNESLRGTEARHSLDND